MGAMNSTSRAALAGRSANAAPADALVFFVATGDLAYKKILPAFNRVTSIMRPGADLVSMPVELSAVEDTHGDELDAYERLAADIGGWHNPQEEP
ncbi:MAG TPA: hypothetical protein VGC99_26620 [Candidatus Tectomicrobia bacterium]